MSNQRTLHPHGQIGVPIEGPVAPLIMFERLR
jgi:hypothetical protein